MELEPRVGRRAEGALASASREGRLRSESQLCLMHDMCAPLATILGTLELLAARGVLDAQTASLVESSIHAARRELRLVQSLVDVFVEDGADPPVDPAAGVASLASCAIVVIAEFRGAFGLRGTTLAIDLPAGEDPLQVRADRLRLERVLGNLLDNALRHVPPGGTVTVQCARESGFVTCVVEDDGPGVAPAVREHLFARIVRGSTPGLAGIGLYSCRRSLERYGGRIACEDRPGGGARFRFVLPEAPPPA
jgi:signal transduction histidine kinase